MGCRLSTHWDRVPHRRPAGQDICSTPSATSCTGRRQMWWVVTAIAGLVGAVLMLIYDEFSRRCQGTGGLGAEIDALAAAFPCPPSLVRERR